MLGKGDCLRNEDAGITLLLLTIFTVRDVAAGGLLVILVWITGVGGNFNLLSRWGLSKLINFVCIMYFLIYLTKLKEADND